MQTYIVYSHDVLKPTKTCSGNQDCFQFHGTTSKGHGADLVV